MNKAITELELHLPHVPHRHGAFPRPYTRHEPLIGKGGKPYPHPKTKAGMRAWREAWFFAGSLVVPSPIVLEIYVRCSRPEAHYRAGGKLNTAGSRYRYPTGFDCSNVVKLVEDALKGYAMDDDAHIVALHASKRWVSEKAEAGTFVTIRTAMVT